MSKKLGMMLLMLIPAWGTGCCWFHSWGCYDQCCGTYDPCTGLVYNECDPCQGYRSKRISKKLQKDHCNCDRHDCHGQHHGGCDCNHGMPQQGYSSGCPDCQSYGQPVYSGPIYGEPVYGEPVGSYYEAESYPELMVPHEMQPTKPVPAPPAEPKQLSVPQDSSIPPASYEVPAPLEGPDVPMLLPYQGR